MVELLFLVSELVGEVLVTLVLRLDFLLEKLDVRVLVSTNLGQETLLVGLFFSFELLFEIFVGIVGGFLLIVKLFFFILEIFCGSFKIFDQDGFVLKLHMEYLDFSQVIVGFGDLGLELGHAHEF
jgi:hypothetical protein